MAASLLEHSASSALALLASSRMTRPSGANLHDLPSQSVFGSLVRTPATTAPPKPRLNWPHTCPSGLRPAAGSARQPLQRLRPRLRRRKENTGHCPPVAAAKAPEPPKKGGPARAQTIAHPEWWPYPQISARSHSCPCVRPPHRCYGLCLRPIHVGERAGHGDHKC